MAGITAREVTLEGRGTTRVLDIAGPPGAPTLLLLHGLGATGPLNWRPCFRPLGRDFRVLCVDHRGHGRGLRTKRFRLEDCADDAVALGAACGVEEFIPVGYSMGGPIASLVWKRHRERVRGLVLCATARHFASQRLAPVAKVGLGFAELFSLGFGDRIRDRMDQRMMGRAGDPAARERIRQEIAGHDPTTLLQASRSLMDFSSHAWIGDVDVPAAVIAMKHDELVPPSRQRKLAQAIPGAKLYEIDGDHLTCANQPERFAALLSKACLEVRARL